MFEREHFEAMNLVHWFNYAARRRSLDHRLLFAIPNGGHRHITVASKMKAEGVRRGVPDYMLAIPKNGKPGMFIELKSETGSLSTEQKEMRDLLVAQGYHWVCAKGSTAAINAIEEYLGPPPQKIGLDSESKNNLPKQTVSPILPASEAVTAPTSP